MVCLFIYLVVFSNKFCLDVIRRPKMCLLFFSRTIFFENTQKKQQPKETRQTQNKHSSFGEETHKQTTPQKEKENDLYYTSLPSPLRFASSRFAKTTSWRRSRRLAERRQRRRRQRQRHGLQLDETTSRGGAESGTGDLANVSLSMPFVRLFRFVRFGFVSDLFVFVLVSQEFFWLFLKYVFFCFRLLNILLVITVYDFIVCLAFQVTLLHCGFNGLLFCFLGVIF